MKLISEILKCTAKKGNISKLVRGGFSENFIKKFNFRRPPIIPLFSLPDGFAKFNILYERQTENRVLISGFSEFSI